MTASWAQMWENDQSLTTRECLKSGETFFWTEWDYHLTMCINRLKKK